MVFVRRPTMNSPSHADRLGSVTACVYCLVEVSVTAVMVLLQILIGYRCSVDKATNFQRVCSFFIDTTPARPTDWLISRCGWWVTFSPLTNWELITVEWTYSGYQLQLARRLSAGGFAYRPSLNDPSIIGQAVYCSLKYSMARNSVLDTEKFFRVSRVSLTSLILDVFTLVLFWM